MGTWFDIITEKGAKRALSSSSQARDCHPHKRSRLKPVIHFARDPAGSARIQNRLYFFCKTKTTLTGEYKIFCCG